MSGPAAGVGLAGGEPAAGVEPLAGARPVRSAVPGPGRRELLRRAWLPVAVALVLLVLAGLALAVRDRGRSDLDPTNPDRAGGQALATLLADRGVPVDRVPTLDLARPGSVLVTSPGLLPPEQLTGLLDAGAGRTVVLVGAQEAELGAAGLPVRVAGSSDTARHDPGCDAPAAQVAGAVRLGGNGYQVAVGALPPGVTATGCYRAGGAPTLVTLSTAGARVVLLGSGSPLTNAELGREGDAALALGLLGGGPRLQWVVPDPAAADTLGAPTGQGRSVAALLPLRVKLAAGEVLLAAVLLALWQGRRLGPVVYEPLPVVVRAAETVEGQGRLYQAAGARGQAAAVLREATARRLGRALGVATGAGGSADPGTLVDAAAARAATDPREVGRLLYGPAPADDAALVRLATDLDMLTEVLTTPLRRHPAGAGPAVTGPPAGQGGP